jgi:predicted amidophosphoribosyltransferase
MALSCRPIQRPDMIAVPVPLHLWRHLARRYNQSALLAEHLAHQLGIDWSPDVLQRREHTRPLDGKSREERFATLSGVISASPDREGLIRGRPVLLVDDVMTSGATLAAAAEACLAAGATEVCVSVLARVAKDT